MLKTLGIIIWACCLLLLAYQAITWVITATWPSVTLLDALSTIWDIDYMSLIDTLPFDIAIKGFYVCFTTQLTLFLWWLGVSIFCMSFAIRVLRK